MTLLQLIGNVVVIRTILRELYRGLRSMWSMRELRTGFELTWADSAGPSLTHLTMHRIRLTNGVRTRRIV